VKKSLTPYDQLISIIFVRQKFAAESARQKQELVEQYATQMLKNEDDMEKVTFLRILLFTIASSSLSSF
jgi:hypothetical protein